MPLGSAISPMKEPPLSEADLEAALDAPGAPHWQLEDGALTKTVACCSFFVSLAFVTAVGELA